MTPEMLAALERTAVQQARRALKLVSANLPHLAGLAHTVRLRPSRRYPVAAIGPSGLLLVNPWVFAEAALADLVFVLAHELLHLALDTFGRTGNADPYLVNVAHDWVINDILTAELRRPVPLGGLVREGARRESLEMLVSQLGRDGDRPDGCWTSERPRPQRRRRSRLPQPRSAIQEQLEKLGLVSPEPAPEESAAPEQEEPTEYPPGDALTEGEEAAEEPELSPPQRRRQRERIRREAVKAVSLQELRSQMEKQAGGGAGAAEEDASEAFIEAIRTAYQPPWQLALQHWLDAVAPGPRSFARPSRRGADRDDVILPGRKREGWTLHVVLDTSGSMAGTLPHVLGLMASFCEGAGVSDVHLLQCDVGVTRDDWTDVSQLGRYPIAGFGGSDMTPAMLRLAEDPEVAAVLVLTDGYIDFPAQEPPYAVLWGLVSGDSSFDPPYGTVVHVSVR
jgi:predicted metal-dependent peptidase